MENLPHKQYERNMNHNYMILGKRSFFGQADAASPDAADYRAQMLLHNKIKGLLPVTYRQVNGEERYYYEINSLQSLDKVCAKNEMKHRQLVTLLQGCIALYNELEKYLLDGAGLVLAAEYIYVNIETMEPYFVYYPPYEADARESFAAFIEQLLELTDHTDEQAVMLTYQAYRCTRNQNYVLSEISGMMTGISQPETPAVRQEESAPYTPFRQELGRQEYLSTPPRYESIREEPVRLEKIEKQPVERKSRKDLQGAVLCGGIMLAALGLLMGENVLEFYTLTLKHRLYLYGTVSMALAAAVIFFACYIRRKRKEDEIEKLQEEEESAAYESVPMRTEHVQQETAPPVQNGYGEIPQECYGDTVCLEQLSIQEYCLRGRVGDEEVTIRLNRLPLTIGKLPGWADCIIADSTVSKLHARIEEQDGKIYIEDLNSTNGTRRNGMMLGINEPVELSVGDELTLGRVSLHFCG